MEYFNFYVTITKLRKPKRLIDFNKQPDTKTLNMTLLKYLKTRQLILMVLDI
jgi:hypothetical protein